MINSLSPPSTPPLLPHSPLYLANERVRNCVFMYTPWSTIWSGQKRRQCLPFLMMFGLWGGVVSIFHSRGPYFYDHDISESPPQQFSFQVFVKDTPAPIPPSSFVRMSERHTAPPPAPSTILISEVQYILEVVRKHMFIDTYILFLHRLIPGLQSLHKYVQM